MLADEWVAVGMASGSSSPYITIRSGQRHVDNTSGTCPPASFLLRALLRFIVHVAWLQNR